MIIFYFYRTLVKLINKDSITMKNHRLFNTKFLEVLIKFITVIVLLFGLVPTLSGQNAPVILTIQEKNAVVDSISKQLKTNYVFPEIAEKMAKKIKASLKKGEYKAILNPWEFADKLTNDLQSISNDRHISVRFDPDGISQQKQAITEEDKLMIQKRELERLKQANFDFKELKILDGNIGYLNLTSFVDTELGGETAVAAMNFLSNTDAIIIDLRENGGGSPSMIQLITSYFYEGNPVHLNDFYWRSTNEITQSWTLPFVPGKQRPDMKVYILTSNQTFSAAEEFCYNLKNLGRATIIGETTGGGANPGGPVIATDRFVVWIPTGRAINPISKNNWEGTGVKPDIEVVSGHALEIAQLKVLEELMKCNNEREASYRWIYKLLKANTQPEKIEVSDLKLFVGKYEDKVNENIGVQTVIFENNKLYHQIASGEKFELIPYNQKEFIIKDIKDCQVGFLIENNKVIAMELFWDNGESVKLLKMAE